MTDENRRKITRIAHEVRTWGAVAIIGAGASLQSGLPLTAQLQSLIWHAVDADEQLRNRLASDHGWAGRAAREMIEDDPTRTRIALEAIASSRGARSAYQHGFTRLNRERGSRLSPAHDALAELLHRRAIETVISFNWDTLLEAAYRWRYGRSLRADGTWLHKPHGDAAHPDIDWVLPHEAGIVPEGLTRRMQELTSDRPRVLLIVGYSESDEEIVTRLISPLSERWRVVRIGPSASGEFDLPLGAEQALPVLARMIYPMTEVSGWEYVNFDEQHDLGRALAGERLGPKDVVTCPRLPEVGIAKRQLAVTNSALIVGQSGSGKSITAYQAAYDLHREEWEVIRLVDPRRDPGELLLTVNTLPYKTALIVDDAQAIDQGLTRRLIESASPERKVIVVTTDEMPSQSSVVRVAGARAVATIADTLSTTRRHEALEVVRRLDNRVGEGYMDISLEWKIEDAAREETPWRFCYILTSGEWRSREGIAALRDVERADLLLAAVAAGQLVSSDQGTSRAWLERATEVFGRSSDWLTRSLEILRTRRLVIGDGPFRCTHQRFAVVALESIYSLQDDQAWNALTRMLRAALRFDTPQLGGVYTLLRACHEGRSFPGSLGEFETVIDDDMWQRLTERCWAAQPGRVRRDAIAVLTELLDWHHRTIEAITTHTDLLGKWLENTEANSASNLRWLLNNVSQKDARSVVEDICDRADPSVIAASIARATWSESYSWGDLLGGLWMAREEWRRRLISALDVTALRNLVASTPAAQLFHLNQLLYGLASLDKDLALQLTEESLPRLSGFVNGNPAEAFHDINDIVWHILGYPPAAFMRAPISRRQKELARRFALSLDPALIARAIPTGRQRDWHKYAQLLLFLRQTVPQQVKEVVAAINFDDMERATEGLWGNPPDELDKLIGMLDFGENQGKNPLRTWIRKHASEYGRLNTTLATLNPEEAISRLRAGQLLDLEFARGNWGGALHTLGSLAKVNEAIAIQVLENNQPALSKALVNIEKWDARVVELFIKALRKELPDVLTAVLDAADPDKARENWTRLLRGKATEKRAALAVLEAASSVQGPIASVVTELHRRFPSAGSQGRKSRD